MFIGKYKHSLDAKGRLSIPKNYLERIPHSPQGRLLYGTLGLDGCVFLVCPDDWQGLVDQVREANLGSEGVRRFSRSFFSMARELPVDGSGRIRVPPEHREAMKLGSEEREVLLLGVDMRIELWSPKVWGSQADTEGTYEDYAKEIFRA